MQNERQQGAAVCVCEGIGGGTHPTHSPHLFGLRKFRDIFDFAFTLASSPRPVLLWRHSNQAQGYFSNMFIHVARTHAAPQNTKKRKKKKRTPTSTPNILVWHPFRSAYKMQMQTAYELVKRKQAFVFCNICPKTTQAHVHAHTHRLT